MKLREQVNKILKKGINPSTIWKATEICLEKGDNEALSLVKNLYDHKETYSFEEKLLLSNVLLFWGKNGIDCLIQVATENPRFKNINRVLIILSLLANGDFSLKDGYFLPEKILRSIQQRLREEEDIPAYARTKLIEFLLSFKDETDISISLGTAINSLGISERDHAIKELIAAMGAIHFAVGKKKIKKYENLIRRRADEPNFQSFFEENPQFLDPNVIQIWPKPNLGGKYIPDFILRRFDDSYVVVEIETPSKQLLTKASQLSALATQAEQQVINYKGFLIERIRDLQHQFPNFNEPEGLVIIGLENPLLQEQKKALKEINKNRAKLTILGFDKLKERAETITQNVIHTGIEIQKIKFS